jgi:hypothetical protein
MLSPSQAEPGIRAGAIQPVPNEKGAVELNRCGPTPTAGPTRSLGEWHLRRPLVSTTLELEC